MYFPQFGENLKQLRKSRNLTQKELGGRVGLSKAVVSKYENSLGYPSFDVLVSLAEFFHVSTDYLLGISKGKTVDVSKLTNSQIDAVCGIIAEFERANQQ